MFGLVNDAEKVAYTPITLQC